MYVIGLDVGTTGTKAIVTDKTGKTLGIGYQEYGLDAKGDGFVEQNPNDWISATVTAIKGATKNIDKSKIKALSISTQGASMTALDENFKPLMNAITWMDTRSQKQIDELCKKISNEELYRKTGWCAAPTLDVSKIIWIRENKPEIYKKAKSFVSTIEYVNYFLCGKNVIDPSNAAIRQMLDIQKGDWDEEILKAAEIDKELLPKVLNTGTLIGNLTKETADILGLDSSVEVYMGAHDQYCASIGSGAVNDGDMLLSTGTTWVIMGVSSKPLFTKSYIAPGVHPVKGKFGSLTSLVSAGCALKWYKNLFGGDFKVIDKEAETRMERCKDLIFLPYVAGSGVLHGENNLTGSVIGMTLQTDKYDLARALMEGVAMEARFFLEEYKRNGCDIKKLKMVGGAAKSDIWSRIVGAVTGCEIYRMAEADTCCIGSAMIAAVGCGMYKDYTECAENMISCTKLEDADSATIEFYNKKYEKYKAFIESVKKL